jgi:hypothetical protein
MSEYIHKADNVSVLIYHIVCPTKYRRVVISEEVDKTLKEACKEIEKNMKAQGEGKDNKQLYKIRTDENQPGLFD